MKTDKDTVIPWFTLSCREIVDPQSCVMKRHGDGASNQNPTFRTIVPTLHGHPALEYLRKGFKARPHVSNEATLVVTVKGS